MRIGIDLDGVLTNIEKFMIDYGSKFCFENNLLNKIKPDAYWETDMFGISKEESEQFWNKYLVKYASSYPIRDFAAEVIKKLKSDGHEIYIITARNEDGLTEEYFGKMHEIAEKWLKDNGVEYDRVIYTEGSKVPYCVGNYIELMIEDNPTNIREISEKIPVYCYDNLYNKDICGDNITRVYSWYDIYNKITKIK